MEDFFDFVSGKVNKNTVECLVRLCCILLKIHYKEVVGNPWTFFSPLLSSPCLSQHPILHVQHGLQKEQVHSKSC